MDYRYPDPASSDSPIDRRQYIRWLRNLGMLISDERNADRFIARIGIHYFDEYTSYRHAEVRRYQPALFRPNTTFAQIETAISFDERLKDHVMSGARTIELWLRSTLSYETSARLGDSAWYLRDDLLNEYAQTGNKLHHTRAKAAEAGTKLGYGQSPPLWQICNHMSFGFWSIAYELLGTAEKILIADQFTLSPSTLQNWLMQIVGVRNICGHHHILWASNLSGIAPADDPMLMTRLLNSSLKFSNPQRMNRISMRLYTIHYLIKRINPNDISWIVELKTLMTAAPILTLMGFREGWDSEPEWT